MVIFLLAFMLFASLFSIYKLIKTWPNHRGDSGWWVPALIGAALFAIIFGTVMSTISEHTSDLGQLRMQKAYIAALDARVLALKTDISHMLGENPSPSAAVLLNADSPVKSMVEQLALAESDLAKTKVMLIDRQAKVEDRKAGMFWFVVTIYGAS